MKRNKKLTITALVAMLFMAIAVTFLSFSHADEELTEDSMLVAANDDPAADVGSKTNIDYIIENSYSTDTEVDPNYNIIEIYSDTESGLAAYCSSKNFENYVVNGYSTQPLDSVIKDAMNTGKVNYKSYAASSIKNSDTDILIEISNADLIYINQGSTKFSLTNDICENLYDILHTYAVGDYKPIIINSEQASGGSGGNTTTQETMATIATDVFSSGMYYYTFAWDRSKQSVGEFLAHSNGSMYLGINGKNQNNKGKWITLEKKDGDGNVTETKRVSKFLVLSGSGTDTKVMRSELLPDSLPEFADYGDYTVQGTTDAYALPAGSTSKLYNISGTIVATSIYNAKYTVPDAIQVDEATLADVDAGTVDLAAYDFVIIDETATGNISGTLYNKLAGAMYASVSMVYPSGLATSTSTTSNTVTNTQAYNYLELYYMVATTENVARYDNIMVTTQKELNTIMAGGEAGAGAIATLINKSTYRGIGGKGSSSNMYTVLEIEPCYPIDEALAQRQGGKYYTIPANVLNDVDKDTLSRDADGNIDVEYYDWEISKKKISDAVGVDASKINIVHMSTEELAASKEPILGTYDLIYVGGNKTALKEPQNWRNLAGLMNWGYMSTSGAALENYKYFPIYTMYTHNGDMVAVSVSSLGYSGGDVKTGSPAAEVYLNGNYQSSFSLLNGNDISYDRLTELNNYVEAGMPVIIEDDVTKAYEAVLSDGYLQNSIDPDCNMRKFLDTCYARKTTTGSTAPATTGGAKNTVLWGISNTSNDATFTDSDKVNNLVKGSTTRPKLIVTSMPVTYNYYDQSTRLSEGKLNFTYQVEGSTKWTTKLLVDDDGDCVFETEISSDNGDITITDSTVKCTLSDKFFGPIYWKLEVTDTASGMTAYTTGISYIKNSTGKKQTVRVLQIMPGAAKKDGNKIVSTHGEEAQGSNALYFCPICQQAYQRLEYYPLANSTSPIDIRYSGTGAYNESTNTTPSTGHTTSSDPYLGQHEHIFGLPKYDSNLTMGTGFGSDATYYTGVDDWSTNLADDVGDLYDFDIDIFLRGEFEEYSRQIAAAYDFSGMTAAQKTAKINAFSIDATDPDYAEWSALTTDDAKLKFITRREYQDLANGAYQNYVNAKADTETAVPALRTALQTAINVNSGGYAEDLNIVLQTGRYSDIFSAVSSGGTFRYTYPWNAEQLAVANAYFDYRDLKEIEVNYHKQYKEYSRFAYPDNWLLGCYDMIIIGPSDDFAGDDITDPTALADLIDYMANDGSLLLFHDTLTASRNSGSHVLTSTLRDYFGMNRNRGLSLGSGAATGTYYLPYTSSNEDRYFMTNLSYKAKTDTTRYASWVNDMKAGFSGFSGGRYLTDVVYTDSFATTDYGTNGASGGSPYKYGQQYWEIATTYMKSSNANFVPNLKAANQYGTDKASRNNVGIVTQYPFTLSDDLNISPTHAQHYALELDATKMTVWYSLAGGNNGAYNGKSASASSMYAASRNDGMDNYFIYSYGNVNYCGAGHSKVTGVYKDNNDERRLYINIIVNSVKNSVNQPGITVYDYKTETKKKKDGTDYIIEVKNTDDWPEFSFSATVDTSEAGNKLERVRIYYDLDYLTHNSDAYVNDAYHILIADMTKDKDGNPLKSGTIYDVGKELAKLQLKPEYFEAYNQEYTYIVIEVTDSKGNVSHQRIKIKLLPYLFEMTQNDINIVLDKYDKA